MGWETAGLIGILVGEVAIITAMILIFNRKVK